MAESGAKVKAKAKKKRWALVRGEQALWVATCARGSYLKATA